MTRRKLLLAAAFIAAWGPPKSAQANRSHVVQAGDTLWDISVSYGCGLGLLRESNPLQGDRLSVGQELAIPVCHANDSVRVAHAAEDAAPIAPAPIIPAPIARDAAPTAEPSSEKFAQSYLVAAGDTLGGIGSRFDISVAELMRRNQLKTTTIYPGQTLELVPGEAMPILPVRGQSIGLPYQGRLADATKLHQVPGSFIRRPHRAYGASHTVEQLARILKAQGRRFPRLHRLAVGDLSAENGGKISMHVSHQSGRDVDLGFYFKSRPKGYPESFAVATEDNLHFEATWALLTAFTDLAAIDGGVEKVFLSYSTQRLLYKLARKRGVSKATLGAMFQYPHGQSSAKGIIRHQKGHDEHMHVRFKCPPRDKKCH